MFLTRYNHKISIVGGLLLLGLTLATGIAVYSVMRQEIENTLGRGLDVALQSKAHLLESQIEKGLAKTQAIITRPFLARTVQQLNEDPGNSGELHELQKNLDSLQVTGYTAAIVYDSKGNSLSQTGEFSNNKKQSLPLSKFDDKFLLWNGQFFLSASKDILNQDGLSVGRITVERPLPELTRSFSEIRTIGETGKFILCAPSNESTQKVDCLISQIGGVEFKQIWYMNEGEDFPMNYALKGMSGVMAVKDYRHVAVIEAYAPLHTIGLGMVLKLDEEELFKPITEKLKTLILYLSVFIIAEILLLNWFIRKFIKSENEARIAKEKSEQVSMALGHKEMELRERLKETTCLYEIRRSIGLELSIDKLCQKIFEFLIPAVQFPHMATVVIEVDGWKFTSGKYGQDFIQHPTQSKIRIADNHAHYREQRDLACSTYWSEIRVNGEAHGKIRVFYPADKSSLAMEEQRLIDAIAIDLAMWIERMEVDRLLRERLKEITCLYEIQREIGLELSVDKVCQNIFKHLIPALQFPEIANASIELDGKQIMAKEEEKSANRLQSEIKIDGKPSIDYYKRQDTIGFIFQSKINVNGKQCGQLSVFYPEDKPYLMQEEQKLIDAIANSLESWLERRRLEQALVFVSEEQQQMIGQELHDNLGQQIAAIGYQAKALEKRIIASGDENLAKVAASIATQAQIAVIQTKQVAQGLLPFELEANGLIAALQALAERIATTYSIACTFSCESKITINDNNQLLNVYRIAQEAINNAIRHGHAQYISISLISEDNTLCLSICDDGCGLINADINHEAENGMGIKIMQYRAKQMGARLEFLSRAEGGMEVRLVMRVV